MSNFSFNNAPVLKRSRCSFDLSHTLFTDLNCGTLKPILVQEVYPGDQFNIQTKGVIRTCYPFRRPIMDNIFIDEAFFFVPYRTISDDWEECITGGTASPNDWVQPKETSLPVYTSGTVVANSVLDAIGVPPGTSPWGVSALPARAFAKVWNEWFRDENTELSCLVQKGSLSGETPNGDPWAPNNYVGLLPKVNKLKDYFTTALRSTQKGSSVSIPLSLTGSGFVPLRANGNNTSNLNGQFLVGVSGGIISATNGSPLGLVSTGLNGIGSLCHFPSAASTLPEQSYSINKTNLGIKGSELTLSSDTPFTVNDLRYAFAVQRILERSARSGSRYTEYIHSAFGVTSPDGRLQRSEYLGGSSTPINVQQVANTFGESGQTTGTSSLGSLGAYSLSNNVSRCSKAFTEHGYIIGVAWIRQFHTYQQGVEAYLLRKNRYDFYDPALMNIGEQPIYKRELFNTTQSNQNEIFGYKEAWADMRYRPNRVSGLARSSAPNSDLDFYHLADFYASAPTLTSSFINETPQYVWRAMGVEEPADGMAQFVVDFRFTIKAIRELPAYSVPSLIDHN